MTTKLTNVHPSISEFSQHFRIVGFGSYLSTGAVVRNSTTDSEFRPRSPIVAIMAVLHGELAFDELLSRRDHHEPFSKTWSLPSAQGTLSSQRAIGRGTCKNRWRARQPWEDMKEGGGGCKIAHKLYSLLYIRYRPGRSRMGAGRTFGAESHRNAVGPRIARPDISERRN